MGRYLIIANQTLGGPELEKRIGKRIACGEGRFHVVVPVVIPEHEVPHRVYTDPMFLTPLPAPAEEMADVQERARKRSEHRLQAMIRRIEEMGGEATGELGDPDPYRAAKSVLEREHFNEVIVSTLPLGISRWIMMDLPSRIERLVDVPVTTVEAQTTADA